MLVITTVKATLVENYEEAMKVEADLDSIPRHTSKLEVKPISNQNPVLLTKPKEEHSNELENVVKMVHRLSNKIVDLEKEKGASSLRKPFKAYYKKREESRQPQLPLLNFAILNFNEVGMDHSVHFIKKTTPKKVALNG